VQIYYFFKIKLFNNVFCDLLNSNRISIETLSSGGKKLT